MSDLLGNPDDKFSRDEAHIIMPDRNNKRYKKKIIPLVACNRRVHGGDFGVIHALDLGVGIYVIPCIA